MITCSTLGMVWIIGGVFFVDAYLEAMVENLLGIEVDAEILDGTVTLRIPVAET